MTDTASAAPSDAEIDAQWRESVEKHETTAAFVRDFARAVLAKWGMPQADYDHGPQSKTVQEAARHVGKWLNERPNRPLDLRDVAMLSAHAQAQAAESVLEDAVRESEYQRGYRHGYEQRDAEVRGALA